MKNPNSPGSRDVAVLDTSVILHDSSSIYKFNGNDVVIPIVVLDEIDKFRSLDNEKGRNARQFIRSLNEMIVSGGSLSDGVERLDSGERVLVKFLECPDTYRSHYALDLHKNDDLVLATCLELASSGISGGLTLYTRDMSLLVKGNAIGLKCQDYNSDTEIKDRSELYSGMLELQVAPGIIDQLYENGLPLEELADYGEVIYPNQGLTLVNHANPTQSALAICRDGVLKPIRTSSSTTLLNVSPRNREQSLAFDLMLDPNVKLVTLTGAAGTGKTLIAMACAAHLVMEKHLYDRIVVSRPIQPLGKDIGYLPGDMYEKMEPWIGPIKDAIEFLFSGDRSKFNDMRTFNFIDIEPLTYIRGRSLPRTLFILDEAQNLTHHEMKTIITRIGIDSKIILTGDVFQIDNHYLDTINNGLTSVIEKFKSSKLAGHVSLFKGQRSELATLAAKIL